MICPYIVDTGLCKNPKIKFPSLMKILTPQEAADSIVDAVRRNYYEITIPSSLYYINMVSCILDLMPKMIKLTGSIRGINISGNIDELNMQISFF